MLSAARYPAARAYATVGLETGVTGAPPHRLIQLLLDGALLAIAQARQAMQQQDPARKGESISKAIQIIDEGLKASLDPRGGELYRQLQDLYDYMGRRLLHASLRNSQETLDEVTKLLQDIRSAWQSIAPPAGER